MAYEMMVGLQVHDDASYAQYRVGMTPILTRYGGRFRYDFKLAEVLKSETEPPINRVFVITFPSEDVKKRFFADPEYMKVRETWFNRSVSARTVIAEYARD